MNSQHRTPRRSALLGLLVMTLLGALPLTRAGAAPAVQPGHSAYFPGESISVRFSGGPGNSKDWVGVYPPEEIPDGNPGSTVWRYVDDTTSGAKGLAEGSVTFPAGINLGGDWSVYLLLNDGYSLAASNSFKVVDPGTPLVRLASRTVETGQNIEVTFTNGPADAKDWVGFYKEGQTPGGIGSTIWQYVDGTQTGAAGKADGTLTFTAGLAAPGNYVAYLLLNDGYDILASETLTVTAPAPIHPRVLSLSPANGAVNQPPVLRFSASITNGNTHLVPASVRLELDGTLVTPTVTSANGLTGIGLTSGSLAAPGSTHVWKLTAVDDATPPFTLALTSSIVVGNYRSVTLPTPIYFENFDNLAEGSLPDGWTTRSYAPAINEQVDFGDLGSAAYSSWTAVNADRFNGSFVTYGDPASPAAWGEDYHRVMTPNPFNVLNNVVLDGPLASGRFLFANSGYHNGGAGQVLYLFTSDYNLTGKTDIHVAFHSLWEQNQDSLAALEYSIDKGVTWLPVAYFLDGPDVARTEAGEIDAEATFNNPQGDVALYTDENGVETGGTYGAFLGAPISAALAPFIQVRLNDNTVESKRVESYRLPMADNKAAVRLRFAHAGTDSWYWGVDNFGLYSISETPAGPPTLSVRRTGSGTGEVVFEGVLQASDLVTGPYVDVTGVTSPLPVTAAGAGRFYRARR